MKTPHKAALIATAFALALTAIPAAASAAPTQSAPIVSAAKAKLTIKRSDTFQVYKKSGVKLTVTAKKGSKKATGKVTFLAGKKKLKTVKLKKGEASYTLPKTLKKGTQKITVKYGGASKTTTVKVYALSLKLDKQSYVAYFDNYLPVTSTAAFDGKVSGAWIDYFTPKYRSGKVAGDKMMSIKDQKAGSGFKSTNTDWWLISSFDKKFSAGPGVYAWQASFTPFISASKAVSLASFTIETRSNEIDLPSAEFPPGDYTVTTKEFTSAPECTIRLTGPEQKYGESSTRLGHGQAFTLQPTDTKLIFSNCGGAPAKR
jgi:hypothetical protein